MKSLDGKVAVVTGGGTGIGAAVAVALAEEGAKVVITGRREDKLQEAASQFKGEPAIQCYAADVGNRESANTLFAWVKQNLGPVNILVSSAGINVPKRSMAEGSPEDWDKVLQVNATGAYNCMYAVLPDMREKKDGVIVNISSVAGIRASVLGGVAYSASKFAMAALGLTVAEEERNNGIRITNVYPGEVETPILDNRPVPVSAEHRARILQPEDVAAAVLMVVKLPARASVPELTIKPTTQSFV
ncbi:MAG: SDR family NAD(P)-dependent oxidoreductase [Planctomycetaceae bacterium]|nr:SDR family NAD(P)-dependent oxidoreductase [Planctomycetaceae bacterium]